jgi:Mrp family chromosome partitioning ATPase
VAQAVLSSKKRAVSARQPPQRPPGENVHGPSSNPSTADRRRANLLAFGPPGVGKSHLAAALGQTLIENGYRVLFTRTTDMVQRLQPRGAISRCKAPWTSSTNTIC